ncbi:hypothetical protein I8J29_06905 [Paenibacillus sp. MWE-103]|uniref:Uncharacterized protein n=1 Tax=Paenibacillus artemisiicola TaxID=1172618 RepID=A0ABS3W6L1_9BACL|nr:MULTISPECIES: hypothetical protein [Paenibacillus]MBO7743918.1 hypothetical protein [Paenibacillus artemisiicola]SFI59463.1 hypothetical protein SAMN02799624_01548 [Paenibacillus sp. UNC496MF]
MNLFYKRLMDSTEDLLYRVRIYDRELKKCDEILQMDEAYGQLRQAFDAIDSRNESAMERVAAKLQQMRQRLITMMEDLLHAA